MIARGCISRYVTKRECHNENHHHTHDCTSDSDSDSDSDDDCKSEGHGYGGSSPRVLTTPQHNENCNNIDICADTRVSFKWTDIIKLKIKYHNGLTTGDNPDFDFISLECNLQTKTYLQKTTTLFAKYNKTGIKIIY